jgi:hypothetical protein
MVTHEEAVDGGEVAGIRHPLPAHLRVEGEIARRVPGVLLAPAVIDE